MQQGLPRPARCSASRKPYEVVPYFFSDLADWAGLEYVGPATEWDEMVWRGDRDAGEFAVFYLKDGKVAGALTVERSEDLATRGRCSRRGSTSGRRGRRRCSGTRQRSGGAERVSRC